MSKFPDDWEARIDELMARTENVRNQLRFRLGVKAGFRRGVEDALTKLQIEGIIFWDDTNKVWLHCYTGSPVKSLEWTRKGNNE